MTAPSSEYLTLQAAVAGRYSLDREIGRGGMGIVFLARDVALDRPVAIKLLPPALAVIPELRERFLREARTAAQLSHPNIVPIHAVEEHGDLVFFVMAYIDGETLGQRVRRAGPLSFSLTARVTQEVAWALGYAHGRGVVHRDIKPDNILLDKGSGRALVTDFGIARVLDGKSMTAKGELVGTAHYMSPEQASGEPIDGRSDLYSLGVTAFYALTGTVPFDAPNLPAIVTKHVTEVAPRIATVREGIPGKLAETVDRCLAKTPEARFSSGEDLAERLGAALGVRQEVAPSIRALLRAEANLDAAAGVSTFAVFFGPAVVRGLWYSDRFAAIMVVSFGVLSIVLPLVHTAHAMRAVLKAGLTQTDVTAAFHQVRKEREEEVEQVYGQRHLEPVEYRWMSTRWTVGGAFLLAIGAALGISAAATPLVDTLAAMAAVLGVVGLYAGWRFRSHARRLVRHGPKPSRNTITKSLHEIVLTGRLGRWLFRLAGIGLAIRQQNAPPATERTELALAGAVSELLERLPAPLRKRFGGIPALIDRLEAAAAGLRARQSELDDAIAAASPEGAQQARQQLNELGQRGSEHQRARLERRLATVEDLERARTATRHRLETAVAAIENIRLDLLRLKAGIGTVDQLTADLEKAQEISAAVSAELAAREEVDGIVDG